MIIFNAANNGVLCVISNKDHILICIVYKVSVCGCTITIQANGAVITPYCEGPN